MIMVTRWKNPNTGTAVAVSLYIMWMDAAWCVLYARCHLAHAPHIYLYVYVYVYIGQSTSLGPRLASKRNQLDIHTLDICIAICAHKTFVCVYIAFDREGKRHATCKHTYICMSYKIYMFGR